MGTTRLDRMYYGFISLLSAGFPLVQAIGVGLMVALCSLASKGRQILGAGSNQPADRAACIVGGAVIVLGAGVGNGYNVLVDGFEAFATHVESRRLPNGLYLPLDTSYLVPDSFWFSIWDPLYRFCLVLGGLFFGGWVLLRARILVAGAHYVFVPHPAERPIREAQQSGWATSPIDAEAVASALDRTPGPEARRMPPSFVSRSRTARAADLTERLKKETELANAVAARERARAEADYWRQQPHRSSTRAREVEQTIERVEREIAELRRRLDELGRGADW